MQALSIEAISNKSGALSEKLGQLAQPARKLYAAGNKELLRNQMPIIGIVGARKVTPYGQAVTAELAAKAARNGVLIVSGLALGVDSIAHKAALDARAPTIAVLPSGLGKIYPASHRQLAHRIVDGNGLLISEYDPAFMPQRHSFIERNRIIAALSDVLLITEAAELSGSLHTARFALEMGKTVAAVPGNITSPMSRGTNNLIRSGAVPILDSQDLLQLLEIDGSLSEVTHYQAENNAEAAIMERLLVGAASNQELLEACGLEAAVFQTHLTMLEIKGVIEPLGNNLWRRRS